VAKAEESVSHCERGLRIDFPAAVVTAFSSVRVDLIACCFVLLCRGMDCKLVHLLYDVFFFSPSSSQSAMYLLRSFGTMTLESERKGRAIVSVCRSLIFNFSISSIRAIRALT